MAPDARLIKTVENPLGTDREEVISSYAVEAEMDGELDWSFVYRVDDGVMGEMGHPGEWTNDFEMWIDDVTSNLETDGPCPSDWCTSPTTAPNGWSGCGCGHRRPDPRRGAAQLGDSTRAARPPR